MVYCNAVLVFTRLVGKCLDNTHQPLPDHTWKSLWIAEPFQGVKEAVTGTEDMLFMSACCNAVLVFARYSRCLKMSGCVAGSWRFEFRLFLQRGRKVSFCWQEVTHSPKSRKRKSLDAREALRCCMLLVSQLSSKFACQAPSSASKGKEATNVLL